MAAKSKEVKALIDDVLSDVIANALTKWSRSIVGFGHLGGQAIVSTRDKANIRLKSVDPDYTFTISIS